VHVGRAAWARARCTPVVHPTAAKLDFVLPAALAPPLLAATLAVGLVPWPGVFESAVQELASAERSVRLSAIERLAAIDSEEARGRLRPLLDDREAPVRQTAARVLCRLGDPEALEAVTAWIAGGTPAERGAGLEALRLSPILTEAARAAVERTLADPETATKLSALEVLSGRDLGPSLPRIAGLLEDSAPQVRLRAVRLLAESRDRRAALPLLGRLTDADRQIQREALAALGPVGDPRVGPALLRVLDGSPDDLKAAAADAAARLGIEAAVPALADLARRRPANALARHAQRALGELGTPAALEVLLELLRTPPVAPETREALLRAGGRVVHALITELESSEGAAVEAAGLLARLGDPRAITPLLAVARRGHRATAAALSALGELRALEALRVLVAAAADRSPEIRRVALEALVAIADDRAASVLDRALQDPDPIVRRRAVALAGRLWARSHAKAVGGRLQDLDNHVRREALQVLQTLAVPSTTWDLLAAQSALAGAEGLLGQTLARTARSEHLRALALAARQARGALRLALLLGVSRALEPTEPLDRTAERLAVDLLAAELSHGGASAEIAAEALATLGPPALRRRDAIHGALVTAEPGVRARLCPLAKLTPEGRGRLTAFLLHPRENEEVQAAAAWALAGVATPGAKAALSRARAHLHPAVAANAQAAAAARQDPSQHPSKGTSAGAWAGVRIADPTGRAQAGLWLTAEVPGVGPVWLRTGQLGQIRLHGLGPRTGAVPVAVAAPGQALEHAGNGLRKISGQER
jgi:HEAT repeat protein